jgi:hypothetical protein
VQHRFLFYRVGLATSQIRDSRNQIKGTLSWGNPVHFMLVILILFFLYIWWNVIEFVCLCSWNGEKTGFVSRGFWIPAASEHIQVYQTQPFNTFSNSSILLFCCDIRNDKMRSVNLQKSLNFYTYTLLNSFLQVEN